MKLNDWTKNYQSLHTVSNLEYAKLQLTNFVVKLQNCDPKIVLFDTGATCSCISYHLFTTMSHKVNFIKKTLKVNRASGAISCSIGIMQLTLNIEEHNFRHNFILFYLLFIYFIGCWNRQSLLCVLKC